MLVRVPPHAAPCSPCAAGGLRLMLPPRGGQGLRFEVHVSTFDETLNKSSFASAAGAVPSHKPAAPQQRV